MFGSRKKLSQEEILYIQDSLQQGKALGRDLSIKQEMFESDLAAINISREQMEADTRQVEENALNVLEYAKQNSIAIAALLHDMEEYRSGMDKLRQDYENIRGQIRQQAKDCQQAVEQNKHFTSPSKILSELPERLHSQNQEYSAQLEEMAEYGKQMGVLALNAAIEAGRMGESGRSFVGAAEDIRTFAKQYDDSVRGLKERIEASDQRIGELENTIHHLVGLLKENNVAAAKLMRDAQTTEKLMDQAADRNFPEELTPMREELMGLRNSEEEIIKSEERNRLQLEDILGEIETQRKNGEEAASEWKRFYDDMAAWSSQLK